MNDRMRYVLLGAWLAFVVLGVGFAVPMILGFLLWGPDWAGLLAVPSLIGVVTFDRSTAAFNHLGAVLDAARARRKTLTEIPK